jgi:hypothetical protein
MHARRQSTGELQLVGVSELSRERAKPPATGGRLRHIVCGRTDGLSVDFVSQNLERAFESWRTINYVPYIPYIVENDMRAKNVLGGEELLRGSW